MNWLNKYTFIFLEIIVLYLMFGDVHEFVYSLFIQPCSTSESNLKHAFLYMINFTH